MYILSKIRNKLKTQFLTCILAPLQMLKSCDYNTKQYGSGSISIHISSSVIFKPYAFLSDFGLYFVV